MCVNRLSPSRFFTLLLTICVCTPVATAELVTVRLDGIVMNVSGTFIPDESPRVGSSFATMYTIDTDAIDTAMSEQLGVYRTQAPAGFTSAIVDGWAWEATEEAPVAVAVLNGDQDIYEVGNSRISTLDVVTVDNLGEYWLFDWRLSGSPDILENTDLVVDPLTLAEWNVNQWSLSFWGSPPAPLYELLGEVTSLRRVNPAGLPEGDANADGYVNLDDLNEVRNQFGAKGRAGFVIGDTAPFDGVVNLDDLNRVRGSFGAGTSPGAVPEPSAWHLSLIVGVVVGCTAKRQLPRPVV